MEEGCWICGHFTEGFKSTTVRYDVKRNVNELMPLLVCTISSNAQSTSFLYQADLRHIHSSLSKSKGIPLKSYKFCSDCEGRTDLIQYKPVNSAWVC